MFLLLREASQMSMCAWNDLTKGVQIGKREQTTYMLLRFFCFSLVLFFFSLLYGFFAYVDERGKLSQNKRRKV